MKKLSLRSRDATYDSVEPHASYVVFTQNAAKGKTAGKGIDYVLKSSIIALGVCSESVKSIFYIITKELGHSGEVGNHTYQCAFDSYDDANNMCKKVLGEGL